ncbi:MAG: AAA family ATPase, partial [Bacteroidales bacterium]|nr:AAA family ATPase [Bacteroidales bacterium]
MLKSLWVENYALIRKIEIHFDSGFHVITGETGAGKSILVGALSLLLGQRADFSMVSDTQKKCIVEGVFDVSDLDLTNFFHQNDIDYDPSLIIRREINPQGKSRAFINDTPVGLNLLKELSSKLFDIHSQHENLLIAQKDFQLNLIDQFAQNQDLKSQYKKNFSEFKKLHSELNQLKESEAKTMADRDYFGFLFNELLEAQLQEEELPKIEEELKSIQNIENIKQQLLRADSILSKSEFNVLEMIKEVRSSLQEIKDYYTPARDLHTRIHSVFIEIDDLATEVSQLEDNLIFNPEKVAILTERLNVLNHLCTKHRVSSDKELIEIKNQVDEKLQHLSSSSNRLE